MKKHTFFNGILVLMIGGVVAKGLGAVYRIPLTWILGVEGIGIYQLVFPIFSLILVLSSTGMPAGISKMIAKRKDNLAEINKILKISLIALFLIGLVFGLLLFAGAGFIAKLQGNSLATLPYLAIAPAVVLVSILSAFRGYFQGRMNMLPTSMSNILEQFFKLIFGLALSFLLMPYGVEYGVLGAVAGVTLSELVAVGYMGLVFVLERKKEGKQQVSQASGAGLFKELFKTSFPIVLANFVLPFSLFIDSLLVVNLLLSSGWSVEQSTILWGIDTGMVTSIVNLPVVLTLSVATVILPSLVSDMQNKQKIVKQSFFISSAISIPCALGVMVLAPQIIQFLYPSTLLNGVINEGLIASQLLSFSAFLIVFTSVLQTQNATLQGLGYSRVPIFSMVIAFVLKTILILVLVTQPVLNIFGISIAKYAFFLTAVTLNGIYLHRKGGVKVGLGKEFWVMAVSGATMAFSLVVFNNFAFSLSPYILLPLEIAFGILVYIGCFVCLLPNRKYSIFFHRKRLNNFVEMKKN